MCDHKSSAIGLSLPAVWLPRHPVILTKPRFAVKHPRWEPMLECRTSGSVQVMLSNGHPLYVAA
jgi:hypothetical protein